MNSLRFTVSSVAELQKLASIFARHLGPGCSLGLSGSLGAGKTEFVRQLLAVYGERGDVVSPSYTLEVVYEILGGSSFELSHWDVYRLAGVTRAPEDLLERLGDLSTLLVVEWPELIEGLVHLLDLRISLKINDDDSRELEVCVLPEREVHFTSTMRSLYQRLFSELAEMAEK